MRPSVRSAFGRLMSIGSSATKTRPSGEQATTDGCLILGAAPGRVSPGVDEFVVDPNGIIVSAANNFILVPLSLCSGVGRHRRVERVEGSRPPGWLLRIRVADLDLVTLLHRRPRVIARIRKPDEDTRIRNLLFLQKLAAQNEVREYAPGIPPKAHAAFARRRAVLDQKPARPALFPVLHSLRRQQRDEFLLVRHRRRNFVEELLRQFVERTRLDVAV